MLKEQKWKQEFSLLISVSVLLKLDISCQSSVSKILLFYSRQVLLISIWLSISDGTIEEPSFYRHMSVTHNTTHSTGQHQGTCPRCQALRKPALRFWGSQGRAPGPTAGTLHNQVPLSELVTKLS